MILKIHEYKEHISTPVSEEYDAKQLDLEFVDFHYLKKISLSGSAGKTEKMIRLAGTLESQIEQTCNRCLALVVSAFRTPFDLAYEIGGRQSIDATVDLRDLLILNHPDQFLCHEGCRGLCPSCGKNLNSEPCQCNPSLKEKD